MVRFDGPIFYTTRKDTAIRNIEAANVCGDFRGVRASRLERQLTRGVPGGMCISESSQGMQAATVLENEKGFFGRVEGMAYVLLDSTSERGLGDAKELDLFQRASLLNRRSQSEGTDLGVEQNRVHVVVLQVLCFDLTNFEVRRQVKVRV